MLKEMYVKTWTYMETTLLLPSQCGFDCEGCKILGGIELIMKLGHHGESHPHSPAALISNSAVSPSAGQI